MTHYRTFRLPIGWLTSGLMFTAIATADPIQEAQKAVDAFAWFDVKTFIFALFAVILLLDRVGIFRRFEKRNGNRDTNGIRTELDTINRRLTEIEKRQWDELKDRSREGGE